jgi:transcriptional regulator with XRE-family HTH domain
MTKKRNRKRQPLQREPVIEPSIARLRIRELLDERGWTLQQLSDRTAEVGERLSVTQLSNMARDEKGFSKDSLEVLAKAFGVSVPQLFEASWQMVPVFGLIEDRGLVRPLGNGITSAEKVRAPAVYGDVLALSVVGDSMFPRYLDGEAVLCAKAPAPPADCIGRESVVQLDNGYTLLRFVHAGSEPGKFVLTSHNQPPIVGATIILCRPVIKH